MFKNQIKKILFKKEIKNKVFTISVFTILIINLTKWMRTKLQIYSINNKIPKHLMFNNINFKGQTKEMHNEI